MHSGQRISGTDSVSSNRDAPSYNTAVRSLSEDRQANVADMNFTENGQEISQIPSTSTISSSSNSQVDMRQGATKQRRGRRRNKKGGGSSTSSQPQGNFTVEGFQRLFKRTTTDERQSFKSQQRADAHEGARLNPDATSFNPNSPVNITPPSPLSRNDVTNAAQVSSAPRSFISHASQPRRENSTRRTCYTCRPTRS